MKTVVLGRTGLAVPQLGFGALPIQRIPAPDAVRLIRRAVAAGIRFFDSARAYSDSEEKLGEALVGERHRVVVATKTVASNARTARQHLETSLRHLRTDYVDIAQLHNADRVPDPSDPDSAYAALRVAREQGLVRFIGLTTHRLSVARNAVRSRLFDTIQFPLSHISTAEDMSLVALCEDNGAGLIAMKALCGGLLTNVRAAFAFFRQFDSVVPIWGIQFERELDEFVALERQPPALDSELRRAMDADRRELAGTFCRGCGYCLPCPAEIPIPMAARMGFLLERAPFQPFLSETWREQMGRIRDCTHCGACEARCPYGLETPALLATMLQAYEAFASAH
ncbi:MAG: aldo/keto reductase [Polyangiaceae bacterium]|jgi:aryl-alcohol dehydrogenase-like predicted oxidoreductase